MMGSAEIIHWILDELEARQANGIEGLVVGSAGIGKRQGFGAQIVKRFEPATEERTHRLIPLHIDTANFAGPIVEIEIRAEFFVFALTNQFARCSPSSEG